MKKIFILSLTLLLMLPNLSLATNGTSNACDDNLPTPTVESSVNDDNIVLSWDKIDHYDLAGYKVVISKNDSSPEYPTNGYIAWITDRNINSYTIDNSRSYNGGDFGAYLSGGENYYFTVTAVYNCGTKVTGNVLHLSYPGDNVSLSTPTVSAQVRDNDIILSWDKITNTAFSGYKIVISKNDSTPSYPDNGYLKYITNRDTTSYIINNSSAYNGGDITSGYLKEGEDYYFTITAVYTNKKITGNVLHLAYPGPSVNNNDDITTDYPVPEVSVVSSDDGVLLSWNKIIHDAFTGYKVVISKTQNKPKYPDHGYARYITDPNTTSFLLNNSSSYIQGDFGGYLQPGENYYFSITALYGNHRVAGNAVKTQYNGPSHQVKEKPVADSLVIIKEKAQLLLANDLGTILAELQALRDKVKEQENEIKYLRALMTDVHNIAQTVKDTLNQFITYGVDENTQKLGEGERAAVIYSYKSAFKKLPETEDEVADAIKIANGRWPSETNVEAETRAQNEFKKIYLRSADMTNPNDNAAVTIMAYGLRQKASNRNLDSERQGIKTFQYIYGRTPSSTEDWNIMQAITYSGATR